MMGKNLWAYFLVIFAFTFSVNAEFDVKNNTLERKLEASGSYRCTPVSLHSYETIPVSQAGFSCIGGDRGSGFVFHDFGTTVKTIRAWAGYKVPNGGLRALFVELYNGKVKVFGKIPAAGPDAQITLSPGETITGSIIIGGNGIGTRAGYIYFKTSAGQEFEIGKFHTPYYFHSGESFLTGFFGNHGSDIDNLGVIMMKPLKSGRMYNLNYPTLESYNQGLQPQVYKGTFCNIGSVKQTQKAVFTKSEGEKRIWKSSISFEFGMSIAVEGSVPVVGKVNEKFSWKLGTSSTYTKQVETIQTQQMEFPVVVSEFSSVSAQFTWFDSKVNLPYTATLEYTFADGTVSKFNVDGIFDGAYISNVDVVFESRSLEEGNCHSIL